MKKKTIIIVSAIVLVIAIAVAAIFIIKGKNNPEQTNPSSNSENFEIYGNDNDVEDIWDVM